MALLTRGSSLITGGAIAAAIACAAPAHSQGVPSPVMQEVLIKTSLMSFNDANVTGNYTVFHAKLSKPFRDQFPPDKLKATFKSFGEQNIDFDVVVAKEPIADQPAAVDNDGMLKIVGHFDTKPSQVKYDLEFIRSDNEWKLVGINVKVGDGNKPKDSAPPAPAPAPAEKSSSGKIQIR